MSELLEDVGDVLMFLGAVVFLVGAVGVIRLPDVYSRLSAVTIAGALGTGTVIIGLFLNQPSVGSAFTLGLALLIQLATTAVGGAAMARAGYLTGAPRNEHTRFDDLEAEGEQETAPERHPGHSRPDDDA
ncbi:monovalent cation/H(+) antiporter subunit G [Nocardiopsis sp. MG754419]|uniref:monovalent cation/H(+) antiporter subunit G n=1 Tax=Nocardiopsis sp. MG754419 TaxID=2259865 RepID=UPI001BAB8B66|nr:monovalent cation/H(+) antiporter subunit G [Nocardiopsis sp. MG754419]MBR8743877.1 cation:proton antiporter [Nocardiopsis sp. MG754419]